jgi:serine/threonine protein kinase
LVQPNPAPIASECPSVDDVAAFLEGRAAPSVSGQILAHIDICESCRALVANSLRTSGDTIASRATGGVPQTFSLGDFIDTRYRIQRFISRGGMGEVYEAWDTELHEAVALKTIACTGLDNAKLFEQLRTEVQLARRITHPNVCRILEFGLHARDYHGQCETVPYFTMELLNGETLRQLKARQGVLSETEVMPLVLQMLEGLAAVHAAGVVHRDLKPDNVFVLRSETGTTRVVVMDFGLARSLTKPTSLLSSDGASPVGTPAYMAPEQAAGGTATTAWDIYAFGVVLFELLTGALPFHGASAVALAMARLQERAPLVSSVNPQVRPAFDKIVGRCLERDPARRFANLQELREALTDAARSPIPRKPRRRTTIVLLMIALTGAVVFSWRARGIRAREVQQRALANSPSARPSALADTGLAATNAMDNGRVAQSMAATAPSIDNPKGGLAEAPQAVGLAPSRTTSNGAPAKSGHASAGPATVASTASGPKGTDSKAVRAPESLDHGMNDDLLIPSFVKAKPIQSDRGRQ